MENIESAEDFIKNLRTPVDEYLHSFFERATQKKVKGWKHGGWVYTTGMFARVYSEKLCTVTFKARKVGHIDSIISLSGKKEVSHTSLHSALKLMKYKPNTFDFFKNRNRVDPNTAFNAPHHERVKYADFKSIRKEASYFFFSGSFSSSKSYLVIRTHISATDSAKLAKLFKNDAEASKQIGLIYKKLLRKNN